MLTRLAIPLGLLTGVAVAIVAVALVVAIAPDPVPPRPAAPTVPGETAAPAGAGVPTPMPSASGSNGSPSSAAASPGPFHVGEAAPPLSVPQLGGGTIDLALLRGKPVWIEFMASWCPSCRTEFPLMSGYAARFADEGLVVVAIDVREDEGTVAAFANTIAAFANQVAPAFPIGLDETGDSATGWSVAALPTHFFVDRDGIVRDGAVGEIGPDLMAAGLERIMPGVTVTP